MRRRSQVRGDDAEHSDDHWTKAQSVAIALQLVEVIAVVALAVVGWIMASKLGKSQDGIIHAIESLHREVEKTEGIH